MKPPLRFLLLCFSLAAFWLVSPAAVAADGITVESAEARSAFPDGLNFTLTATGNAKIVQARLRYRLLPRAIQSTVRAECTGESRVSCKVTVGGSIGSAV